MQQLYLNNFFYKNPTTGEFIPIAGIAGESAYEIAVRLGTFTGTEEEWNNYIAIERDKAIADIIAKAEEARESIPEDYTALAEQVSGKIDKTSIAQELGDDPNKVLSQKAATEEFGKLSEDIVKVNKTIESNAMGVISNTSGLPCLQFDTVNKTCTMLNGYLHTTKGMFMVMPTYALTVDLSGREDGIIAFDTVANAVICRDRTTTLTENETLLAVYANYGKSVGSLNSYSIDGCNYGVNVNQSRSVCIIPNNYRKATLQFDTTAKTVVVQSGRIRWGSEVPITVASDTTLALDYQNGIIVYDLNTNVYLVKPNTGTEIVTANQLLVATYAKYGTIVAGCNPYSVNGHMYGIVANDYEIISPNYQKHEFQGASWSDFDIFGDKFVVFKASSDETHTVADGSIYICNKETFAIEKTIKHDFGHCNTVHYRNGNLLIGNLPGNTEYPSALYIMHNVDSWLDLADQTVLNFASCEKTIIDVSSLTDTKQTVACWGEDDCIVYLNGKYNKQWYKILLGKGTNNLGNGAFASADDGKYNGSFNVLDSAGFTLEFNENTEVTQGVAFYKGKVVTSNGHDGIRGFIWKRTNNRLIRDMILCHVYGADGAKKTIYTEGLCIHNGIVYHGFIDTDNSKGYIATYTI